MSAGLPSDDPLGDRLQGMPLDAFAAMMRGGLSFAWPPGTAFEYSNLGYGVLGRAITNVAGREYREVVEERLLQPLGMTSSCFLREAVPIDRLALGYVRRDERFEPEPIDGYGALAAMGGIFSSVADLARWVAGFTAAFPARDDPEDGHPLARPARREMQQSYRAIPPELLHDGTGAVPSLTAMGYGYGLFVVHDLEIGTVVGHSGGYPGYGSNMRWHPGSGIGVVALANARYARVSAPASDALRALVQADGTPIRRVRPAPPTVRLRVAVEELLDAWDDALADDVFARNMDLDEPRERRRAEVARIRERLGALAPDEERPASDSPAHLRWWLRGERGRLRVEILASPESPPRLQALELTPAPDPTPALHALAERVAALLGDHEPRWPDDVALAASVDRTSLERGLRAAAVTLGRAALGRIVGGDGERILAAELRGDRGRGELRLEVDADAAVTRVVAVPARAAAPPEAP
jgi:CubicO group peptidase (beta-lactamase class C family)